MLRRLHHEQPESFAFTQANRDWAMAQIAKYPEGREASAIIPLLWRAQEQEGWLTRPAIEAVADMLGMAYIRALEVASFYFMFQLQPVGSVAHLQVCGTLSCMICGAEDLIAVCKERIAPKAHQLSADGRFSWEEVECLGSCANAPMAQIGKDYYEDLTAARLGEIIDELAAGQVPVPGPQNGRYAAEPLGGLTSLTGHAEGRPAHNASVDLALRIGDTIKRIDGTEVPLVAPWLSPEAAHEAEEPAVRTDPERIPDPRPAEGEPADKTGVTAQEARADSRGRPRSRREPAEDGTDADAGEAGAAAAMPSDDADAPPRLEAPRGGKADDLKRIGGIGPQIERKLHEAGIWHFDQIAALSDAEVDWLDGQLRFRGRIRRDDWIGQARALAQE